jgi:hypothetical protein
VEKSVDYYMTLRYTVELKVPYGQTYRTAYTLFTPNNSGQRSPPTYYRGCWNSGTPGSLRWCHP